MNELHVTGIFDSHAHYDDESFLDDQQAVLEHLKASDVSRVLNIACSMPSCETSLALAEQYDWIYCAVGIHPDAADDLPDDYLDRLRAYAAHPKVVAIGEIGLDYHYENVDRARQQVVFEEQLALAKELDLPVVIHSREATQDTMNLVRKYRPKGVMHCFSGSAETAKELVELGMYVGFTGVLTFKNAKKAKLAAQAVPADRLLLETDCPYMAPIPFRGKRCDSSMLPYTAQAMAELQGLSTQEMIDQTRQNACRLFKIEE